MQEEKRKSNTNFIGKNINRPYFKGIDKKQKGITLIALIITIIIMLILVGVTVTVALKGGLFKTAKKAAEDTQTAVKQETEMLEYEYQIESAQGTFTGTYDEYVLGKKYAGLKLGDQVNYTVDGYSGEWRVLGIEDGQVLLVATENPTTEEIEISGSNATLGVWDETTKSYKNLEDALDTACESYCNSIYATKARSIRVEDIDKITGYDKTKFGTGKVWQYGNVVTYSLDSNGNVEYSSIVKSGTSDYSFFMIPLTYENITEPYTVTNNKYYYDVYQETSLKDKNSNAYKMLFGEKNDQTYFLASSYVVADEGFVLFGMRIVDYGTVSVCSLWDSSYGENDLSYGVRPVVYLKSDIKLTETTANSGVWNIG